MSFHNKSALYKDGFPSKEVMKKQSRIMEIQFYLTTKIIKGRKTDYRPVTGDEDQPLRDEMMKLRKELGIR